MSESEGEAASGTGSLPVGSVICKVKKNIFSWRVDNGDL